MLHDEVLMDAETTGDLRSRIRNAEEQCLRWEKARLDAEDGLMVLSVATCEEQVAHWRRVREKLRRRLDACRRSFKR